MNRVILIKYGELTTKKDNRNFFIKTLKKNIFDKLSSFAFEIQDDYLYIEVKFNWKNPFMEYEGDIFSEEKQFIKVPI